MSHSLHTLVPSPDDLLTKEEAAAILRVSPRTLERYVADGLITATKVGPRFVRFRRADVLNIKPAEVPNAGTASE